MRTLLLAAALVLATPLAARAQGVIGATARILAPEEVRLVSASAEVERGAVSVPLVVTHRVKPLVTLLQRPGDARCELLEEGARLRCTPQQGPMRARLLIVPNT